MFEKLKNQIDLFGNLLKSEQDLIHIYVEQTKKSSPFIYTKMGDNITDEILKSVSQFCKVDKIPYQDGFRNFTNSSTFEQTVDICENIQVPFKTKVIEIGAGLQ